MLELPKISIGMPVYNGEEFICRSLDSVLLQSYKNFELIISDNASTDSTSLICKEYAGKDNRIRYFRQEKNMGFLRNFNFVLQEAKYEYFMWVAADDYLLPDFLKKNIEILMSDNNIVGSVSKIKQFGIDDLKSDSINYVFESFKKKLRLRFRQRNAISISGTYEEKVRSFLKKSTCQIIYGVFRTEKLRKSIVNESFIGLDWAEILSVLKYGNFHVIDEVLMHEFEGGASSKGIISISRDYNPNFLAVIFPWYPFTFTSARILGMRIFLKNLDFFIRLNCEGIISQIIDLARLLIRRIVLK